MKISKEQKEAIEYLEKYTKWETYGERNLEKDIITVLKLLKETQMKNEKLKARLDELSKNNFQLYIKRDKQMEEIIENKIKQINKILENKSYFNLAERDKLEYAKYLYENLLNGGDDIA